MKLNIVSDSSCDLTAGDLVSSLYDFEVVPMSMQVGSSTYMDDESIDTERLLVDVKKCKEGGSSSCPSPESFLEAFRKADQTICVTMTAAGSGTFASATVAKKMLLEEAPEKQVCIVDSRAIAGVLTLIIKRATELIEENLSYDHVCTTLLEYAKGLEMVAVLQCYDNLIKNGRVTPTVGKIAGHLHIKTIVAKSIHGTIEPIKKICGTKHVFEFMAEKIASKGDISKLPIVISHCKNETGVGMLVDILKEKYHATNISVLLCRGVTSFYAMPGGILVAY